MRFTPRLFLLLIPLALGPFVRPIPTIGLTFDDIGEGLRNGVNSIGGNRPQPQPAPTVYRQPQPQVESSPCYPVADATPVSAEAHSPSRNRLTDPKAIALMNIAIGNSGKSVVRRVGLPDWFDDPSLTDFYKTGDGTIAVVHDSNDRITSIDFVK